MADTGRQAVVILGMHRSGTSAVAGVASRLGLATPRSLLPASDDNPSGFYESLRIVTANFALLQRAGCAWNACLMFEPDQLDGAMQPDDLRFLLDTLRQEYGDAGSFVMKDPRLCLTLPAWLPALQAMGTEVRVLLVARHPAEVVRSLAARNNLPEEETAPHWLHHMLEAERLTRELPRAVVQYDALMQDWRRCVTQAARTARIVWPRPIEQAGIEVDAYLAASLQHHRALHASAGPGPVPVGEMVKAAWIAFRVLAGNPSELVALSQLDQVRARFAAWRHVAFPPGTRAVLRVE